MIRRLVVILAATLCVPAHAQSAESVHRAELTAMGFDDLRPGARRDPPSPSSSDTDPDWPGRSLLRPLLFPGTPETAESWQEQRPLVAQVVETHLVGAIPPGVESFSIEWRKSPVEPSAPTGSAEHWRGVVSAPDGRTGPVIDAFVTFPAPGAPGRPEPSGASGRANAPALIEMTAIETVPSHSAPDPAADAIEQALERGFVHVAYRPEALQPDGGATMQDGIIGLARWPRERFDWGALRAWAWGASALRSELAADPRIDGKRISVAGHTRFGKGALVAAAFDRDFADALVSSSGAGGAKLMLHEAGERWENMASPDEFHLYTPNIMTFAQGRVGLAELPYDAHMLIALRAPRPLLVVAGVAEEGDAWADPRGMWEGLYGARLAWTLHDVPVISSTMPAAGSREQLVLRPAWFQHDGGSAIGPAWDAFYEHEARFSGH